MIELLKALSNEKRLKIIYALTFGRMCQVHIEEMVQLEQVDISRNAKILIGAGIIVAQKDGNRVVYKISDDFSAKFPNIIEGIKNDYSDCVDEDKVENILIRCLEYKE